ncbi:MAG: hypothetical protein ACYTF7_05235 [Planctomycetota bacterium]
METQQDEQREGVLDPVLSNAPGGLLWGLDACDSEPVSDPQGWGHRRGEPRMLALLWSIYLFAASLVTVMQLPVLGLTDAQFVQSSSRLLLMLLAIGVTVLWPMLRLSQVSPRRPCLATWVDMGVLLVPMQAVLWPLTWLGRWDLAITGAVSVLLAGWAVLLGSLVCVGMASSVSAWRAVWMALVLGLCGAAPLLSLVLGGAGVDTVSSLALASPWTAIFAITTGTSGFSPHITTEIWIASAIPFGVGVLLWVPLWIGFSRLAGTRRARERMVSDRAHGMGRCETSE